MLITTNFPKVKIELQNIVNLFFVADKQSNIIINHHTEKFENVIQTDITFIYNKKVISKTRVDEIDIPNKFENKFIFRFAKLCLYEVLVTFTKKKQPWGALTGIRPTKIYYELLNDCNFDYEIATKKFMNDYYVSKNRAAIIEKIVKNQIESGYIKGKFHFYVNIPVCMSRCYYCSFISNTFDKCKDILDDYVAALVLEIKETCKLLKSKKIAVETIFIGGGTPTSLNEKQLEKIFKALPKNISEFTVEAGRPDTITQEKLQLFTKYNVSRICINPQSFNNETLKKIGRTHSAEDVEESFKLARNYKFVINMDLIAGLADENKATFKKSLQKTIALVPDNITVHSLSTKNSSVLKTQQLETIKDKVAKNMVDYSIEKLINSGYRPYYLYKQKYTLSNLENIGYFKDNTPCIFNIASMEDASSIIAVGANAITKIYYENENRIERIANQKNLKDYIAKVNDAIEKKKSIILDF